jgi:hypothetical protein
MVTPLAPGFSRKLVGLVDYENTANYAVVFKIETDRLTDFYINFNRATGINNENGDGGDQVMLTRDKPGTISKLQSKQ